MVVDPMKTACTLTNLHRGGLAFIAVLLFLSGCQSATQTQEHTLLVADNQQQLTTSTPTLTLTPKPWYTFAPSSLPAVTAVPLPAPRMNIPEEVQVWLFLGSDQPAPYTGRTPAIHLAFVNPRLAKASLVSIPSSLFVYLPGYTMQRLNTAYALGGVSLVRETLAYNFGIDADRFIVADPQSFTWLVDDLGGLDVSVILPIRDGCNGLAAGLHSMNGEKALCYVSYLSAEDEVDRTRRQQQILQLLFTKLVQNGRLVQLPVLYASYQEHLDTNFSLEELLLNVPLFLRLGDPARLTYYLLGWNELEKWQLPDATQATVLLPKPEAVTAVFAQALADVLEPSPLSEIVLTYEAQLTQAAAATQTGLPQTPFATRT
ncbi:MAG TPA: LCP family protein, partial [Anaerolineaceae bacterium]|nr:LCP family protein [Anaerolineaceae bacterium]